MMRLALILISVIALVVVMLWGLQRRLIYLPSGSVGSPADANLVGTREVAFETTDGLKLGGWFIPASAPSRGIAVLVANGNAGNRSGRAPLARALSERGLAVLLFDYRGYGRNPGSPSERGLAQDVRAAHRFLVHEAGVPTDRMLYYGESLGAAVVVELATEYPPAGLVLRSPFVDLASDAHPGAGA
jgi:alpha-beta hydrolase superfamily lysophospholipase